MRHGLGAAAAVAGMLGIWGAAFAWPALGAFSRAGGGAVPESFRGPSVAATTVAWAIGASLLAVVPGWIAGRAIRGSRAGTVVLAASILAALLPPYAVYWAWWQSMGPGSVVGDWAARAGTVDSLRVVLLAVGLASWAWPFTAWCVASQRDESEVGERELHAIDRAGAVHSLACAWRSDWPALAVGAAVTAFIVAGSTIAFDLAQVATWGFELRTLDVQGTPVGGVLRAAAPAMAIAAIGAMAIVALPVRPRAESVQAAPRTRGVGALCLVALTVALPLTVLVWAVVGQGALWSFAQVGLRGASGTLTAALAAGALASVVALGHMVLASRGALADPRARLARMVERAALAGWLFAALVPGTVYALALTLAYNRSGVGDLVYGTPAIVVLAEVGRYGAVAAWLGRLAAWHEPAERRQLRAIDAGPWNGVLSALAPQAWAVAIGAALLVAALGAGDVVVTARVEPPGWAWAATSLLNAIHYQQPDAVLGTLLALVAIAAVAAAVVALGWRRLVRVAHVAHGAVGRAGDATRRAGGAAPLLLLALGLAAVLLALPGCRDDAGTPGVMHATRWFGASGRGPGRFEYPRAIDTDPSDGSVLVIDRQARVHRFERSGRFIGGWQMPEHSLGKPTGLCVGPGGEVLVADTHYHRVIVFSPTGEELRRWGSYGMDPGQFIFPCDVAFGPDGLVYVAEFGGNDRVQVFTPQGQFVRQFGRHGREPGDFDRPQAIGFADNGDLYVADACNHRVQVLSATGEPLRVIGGPGRQPGQFVYPYGLKLLPDGTMLVAEFGGNRVQRLDCATGESLEAWNAIEGVPPPIAAFVTDGDGVLPVAAAGNSLRIPWAVAWNDGEMYVLDSGHARVLVAPVPLRPAEAHRVPSTQPVQAQP